MVINSRLYFDDNKPRYRHGCFHIQTVALAIGALQLVCFLYELTDLTILQRNGIKISNYDQYLNSPRIEIVQGKELYNSAIPEKFVNNDGYANGIYAGAWTPLNVKQPWAHAADVAWNGLVAFSIILMFYATKWTRPYLMTPKLVFDAIAAGIVTIGAVTMIVLSVGLPYSNSGRSWLPVSLALCAAVINCYIFSITLRCFKYLLEKRTYLDGAFNGNVFVLPFTLQNSRSTNHQELQTYGSVYSDMPPAYPDSLLSKNQSIPVNPENQQQQMEDNNNNGIVEGSDVTNHLPTYDEAQKLREINVKSI